MIPRYYVVCIGISGEERRITDKPTSQHAAEAVRDRLNGDAAHRGFKYSEFRYALRTVNERAKSIGVAA